MQNRISETFKQHHDETFQNHGATPKGVDWNDPSELNVRYKRLLAVYNNDLLPPSSPTLLDVGCGWGGMKLFLENEAKYSSFSYRGVDIVPSMIKYAQKNIDNDSFYCADFLNDGNNDRFDYVICNAIMTQKLDHSIPEMKSFCRQIIHKMFEVCERGISFTLMSDRVNFKATNLYYCNPLEMLHYMLDEISCRVIIDHGYSSLDTGKGHFYDYIVHAYK